MVPVTFDDMPTIRPMLETEYDSWISISTMQQANDRSTITNRTVEDELVELKKMLPVLLPNGVHSENNYFFTIDLETTRNIGFIWFSQLPGIPNDCIYLMDIHLQENQRSKGYGKMALIEAQRRIKFKGYTTILLSVLANNYAKDLYLKLGYEILQDNGHSLQLQLVL